ncbi:SDR family oxidoreductase [Streptomyces cylindrosporus]|uniref:SDR family oxidoreductase n=1 Tax=Streptomyces cylindrosporus TaxID=2927583 RepID=A0ABS9YDM1_9ACTN|nr:SDR family oxidoreductase [Streptomyces cylindrosporus]MCI3275054.1 SDR family oxidoreductase [Streptomyces cylindrosporus]
MTNTDQDVLPGLKGRVALIVGATRGVGRAVTEKLLASGCDVIANYAHSDASAAQLAADVASLPGNLSVVRADARQRPELVGLLEGVRREHGRLDLLVHAVSSAHTMPPLDIRLEALFEDTAAAVVPLAVSAGIAARLMPEGGRIVVVSASVARAVAPQLVSLGVAKAGLEALVRFLAVELAGRGITVNAVSASKLDKGPGTVRPEALRALGARTPAGRLATPRDVADAVALLCLPEAQWITGQVLSADGGLGLLA